MKIQELFENATLWPTFDQFIDNCAGDNSARIIERLWNELNDDTYIEKLSQNEMIKKLKGKYQKALKKLQQIQFPILVYRKIRLLKPEDLRINEVGLSWSTSERKAQVIYGTMSAGKDFLYRSTVNEYAIDKYDTLYWRMHSVGNDEDELRLKRGSQINNLAIKSKGQWQLISPTAIS
jgi:hypothetical protein